MKYLVITLTLIFTSCSTMSLIPAIVENQNVTEIKKIIEQPYQVNGKWFYPQDYNELIEIGFAKLETTLNNGDLTRTQEYFHHDVLTGSHRSLPLPSIINVTNFVTFHFCYKICLILLPFSHLIIQKTFHEIFLNCLRI